MYIIPEDFEDSDYSPLDVQRWLHEHGVEADLLLTSNGPMFRVPSDSFESETPALIETTMSAALSYLGY
jgi:hypothetical protein